MPIAAVFAALKSSKVALYGVLALGLLTIIGLSYWHYTSLLNDNRTLKANQVQLEDALGRANDAARQAASVTDQWKAYTDRMGDLAEQVQSLRNTSAEQTRALNAALQDLAKRAVEDPTGLERSLNAATDRLLRQFEAASGGNSGPTPGAVAPAGTGSAAGD